MAMVSAKQCFLCGVCGFNLRTKKYQLFWLSLIYQTNYQKTFYCLIHRIARNAVYVAIFTAKQCFLRGTYVFILSGKKQVYVVLIY